MISFRQFEYFYHVATKKSLSSAAQTLGVTSAALSKNLKELELLLKQNLMTRSNKGMELTPQGKALLESFEPLAQDWNRFRHRQSSDVDQPAGTVNVLVFNALCKSIVEKKLMEFKELYPKINLNIFFSERLEELGNDQHEVMIGYRNIDNLADDMRYKKLYPIQKVLCAAPSLIEKIGPMKSLEDIRKFPLIGHTVFHPDKHIQLADGSCFETDSPALVMNDFDSLHKACIDGLGIMMCTKHFVLGELARGEMVQCLPEEEFSSFDTYLYYRYHGYEEARIRAFVDFYCADIDKHFYDEES